jgi:large subunit ribosomal protein L20
MPRVTKSNTAKSRHKKVLNSTKGHYGARSRLFKTAKQSHIKALQYAFRDRKNKKRNFRALWISRINAASRSINVSYSSLINGMIKNNIHINRKILSELAVHDPITFEKIVKLAVNQQ